MSKETEVLNVYDVYFTAYSLIFDNDAVYEPDVMTVHADCAENAGAYVRKHKFCYKINKVVLFKEGNV